MTYALPKILADCPPLALMDDLWETAILEATRSSGTRRRLGEDSPGERMRKFREMIEQELVAFHDSLIVTPHEGEHQPQEGANLWNIAIPLTLFPKRDRGFSRIECIISFCNESDNNAGIRVVSIFPKERSEVMARAEMGAHLEMETRAKLGLPAPFVTGSTVGEVGGRVYGRLETANLKYKAIRMCVETEIVYGTQARWRLIDPREPETLAVESHQLAVVLEVQQDAVPVDAAGYLQAYSDTRWLTSSLGTFWRDFSGKLKTLFQRGVPTEGYSEWQSIIPA